MKIGHPHSDYPQDGSVLTEHLILGLVFLDGVRRVTRLPAIQEKSQVSFAVEKVSSTKLRVYIESQEKQVRNKTQSINCF